jgi:hypothetical protein
MLRVINHTQQPNLSTLSFSKPLQAFFNSFSLLPFRVVVSYFQADSYTGGQDGTRRLIAVFRKARQWTLFRAIRPFTPSFSFSYFNIILLSKPRSSKCKILYTFIFSPQSACPAHLNLLDLITLIIQSKGANYKDFHYVIFFVLIQLHPVS